MENNKTNWKALGILDDLSNIESEYVSKYLSDVESELLTLDSESRTDYLVAIRLIVSKIVLNNIELLNEFSISNLLFEIKRYNQDLNIIYKYLSNQNLINNRSIDLCAESLASFINIYINKFTYDKIKTENIFISINSWGTVNLLVNPYLIKYFELLNKFELERGRSLYVTIYNDHDEYFNDVNNKESKYRYDIINTYKELIDFFNWKREIQDIIIEYKNNEK